MIRRLLSRKVRITAAVAVPLVVVLGYLGHTATARSATHEHGGEPNAGAAPAAALGASTPVQLQYAKKLDELRETRNARRAKHLREAETKYQSLNGVAGFDEEMVTHTSRVARLRRAGALSVAEGRPYAVRTRLLGLLTREMDRHRAVIGALETQSESAKVTP